jgi:hypothetical protein
MQALVQVQRHTVFSIFDSLVTSHRDGEIPLVLYFGPEDPEYSIVLKNMGDQFLSSYIALADGEKDPRNLMVAFAIARVLAIEFDISAKFEVRITFLGPSLSRLTSHSRTSSILFSVIFLLRSKLLQMILMGLLQRISRALFGKI